MQRIEALIEKLRAQFNNKSDLTQLLITTQMIQREINGEMKETSVLGSSRVAVFMPNSTSTGAGGIANRVRGDEKEYFQLSDINEEEQDEEEVLLLQLQHEAGIFANSDNQDFAEQKKQVVKDKTDKEATNNFNPLLEVPTLFQQVQDHNPSTSVYKPVHKNGNKINVINDLNKDISNSDKDRFVRNLFRGDEVMYNRSIKTINNFATLEEAEYWVTRELKTKLGWINNKDVEYFDRLLHRKFSSI